ncbi:NAD(P)/FAD-dependent oxidoreductase [Nonomuraea africana]|uniref:Cyclohexanone monooxygenase n=1 Tax=Nonomuraea africana TaxID=46171 RepID=A0ABR9KVM0_9ACTN|nr:NAD(P)/FAD-dependent oxidoreductase [Nonomuraea africana]MBE1566074.1 cyclohexanone monooxygenase [Nonomuraea africana]
MFDAIIVGAGLSGLYALHRLRGLGLRVKVFEAGDGVGGTWHWNRYPGARCDVESVDYSYSFSPELEQEWIWTERYPGQPEILAYLDHVADRFDLRRDIQLGTRVRAARFDGRWHVTTEAGEQASARYLVMATGCLSVPKPVEVDGLASFGGEWYHTGRWPHEGVDFTGRRVGVVGTGSSGIQSIPIIAEQAGHLTVFQRTPNFSLPAFNRPLAPETLRAVKAAYGERRRLARETHSGIPAEPAVQSAHEVDPDERRARYQAGWERGSLVGILGAYTDLLIDRAANDTAAEFVRSKIRELVEDPAKADLLSPRDHPFGTKRPCLDSGYFETFNRDDVTLVDVRADPIAQITPKGLRTAAGAEYELDTLVFATGFDAMTGALTAVDLRGADGRSLRRTWEAGPRAYLGLAVAGFPNLFTVTGPGSPSVLSNMVVSIEQHVDWIADCLAFLDGRTIEATAEAQQAWTAHVAEVGAATLYPTADSWYMGANVPGKPRVFMPYAGGVALYRQLCEEVAAKDYEGFTITR